MESTPNFLEPQINNTLNPFPQLHTVHLSRTQPWPFFIFLIVYILSSQDSYLPPFFWSDLRHPPRIKPHPVFLALTQCPNTNPVIINFKISWPVSLFLISATHPHHILSQDDVKTMKTDVAHTNGQHIQENSKSASTKRGDHTWRKRSKTEKRKPVPGNGIRLLLFDKCKFVKHLKRKKGWTRQTTHWWHIYQI